MSPSTTPCRMKLYQSMFSFSHVRYWCLASEVSLLAKPKVEPRVCRTQETMEAMQWQFRAHNAEIEWVATEGYQRAVTEMATQLANTHSWGPEDCARFGHLYTALERCTVFLDNFLGFGTEPQLQVKVGSFSEFHFILFHFIWYIYLISLFDCLFMYGCY
jgi:hypothetical protein